MTALKTHLSTTKGRFRVYQLRTTRRLLICIRIYQYVSTYVPRMFTSGVEV